MSITVFWFKRVNELVKLEVPAHGTWVTGTETVPFVPLRFRTLYRTATVMGCLPLLGAILVQKIGEI